MKKEITDDPCCVEQECIFRTTCKRWINNHVERYEDMPDDACVRLMPPHECDTKKWTCYENVDGRLL